LERRGERARALGELRAIIEVCPDYPGALSTLSAWLLPGPHYRDVLSFFHRCLAPKTYLEIGVETGATLALASRDTRAVGVDPSPRLAVPLGDQVRVFERTSDQFFSEQSLARVFDGSPVDFVFIDGMHRFENALSDFAHAERWAHPNATILLHDALVLAEASASPVRRSKFWVGDVYKVVEVLLRERPDLRLQVIPTAPSGLVVVRRLDPNSGMTEKLDSWVARYRELGPRTFPDGFSGSGAPRIVSNDEAGYRAALNDATGSGGLEP
jgi:predicted O-methyltransferase YrrM